jgi:hypothetical protein
VRATGDLSKLQSAVTRRLLRLRRAYAQCTAVPPSHETEPRLAFAAVELDNLVLSAIRQFVISCLTGARSADGQRVAVTPRLRDEGEVAAYVLSVLAQKAYEDLGSPQRVARQHEFKIREPRFLERVMASCAASNLISVEAAFSLPTTLFSDLPTVRNFYAHRNDDTWRKVRNRAAGRGIFGVRTTDEVLRATLPGRPVSLFEDWLDDAELFFHELTR